MNHPCRLYLALSSLILLGGCPGPVPLSRSLGFPAVPVGVLPPSAVAPDAAAVPATPAVAADASAVPVTPEIAADALLAAHNRWRATVGVAPLGYSPELAATAQSWADRLVRVDRCQIRHGTFNGPLGRYGENLFWASAHEWSDGGRDLGEVMPDQVVDARASERFDYDPATKRCTPGRICGHWAQTIWPTTTRVGCAMAVCTDSLEQVWVCHYQPAGRRVD